MQWKFQASMKKREFFTILSTHSSILHPILRKIYKSDRLNSRIFIGKPLLSVGSFYIQRFVSVEMFLSLDTMVYYLFLFIYLFFALLRAALMEYGHSQTRGLIEATCAVLHHRHSDVGSEPHL